MISVVVLCWLVLMAFCRGLPEWLHEIPGIEFRTDNEPFKVHEFDKQNTNQDVDRHSVAMPAQTTLILLPVTPEG